ncbi:MAG: methyltransferase [Desulforhopalus sp.]
MNLAVLCLLWIGWCTMHSLLIDTSVINFIKGSVPGLTRFYRLFYNGLSLATLIPLAQVTRAAEGQVIVHWEGYAVAGRIILFAMALFLFKGGAKRYDLRYFLGIKQLRTGEEHLLLSEDDGFDETGVFGITRHPWYLGSLFLIWSMLAEYSLAVFLAACILSVYLVIGTMLEERKIVSRYGKEYRAYRHRVSMLFPWKWLKRLVS